MNQPSSSTPQKLEPPQKQPLLCYKISRSYYTLHYTLKPYKMTFLLNAQNLCPTKHVFVTYQTGPSGNWLTRPGYLSFSLTTKKRRQHTTPPSLNRFIVCLNSTSTAYDHAQETSSLVRRRNFLFAQPQRKEEEREAGHLTEKGPAVPIQNNAEL